MLYAAAQQHQRKADGQDFPHSRERSNNGVKDIQATEGTHGA
jgi:hypothetical protein